MTHLPEGSRPSAWARCTFRTLNSEYLLQYCSNFCLTIISHILGWVSRILENTSDRSNAIILAPQVEKNSFKSSRPCLFDALGCFLDQFKWDNLHGTEQVTSRLLANSNFDVSSTHFPTGLHEMAISVKMVSPDRAWTSVIEQIFFGKRQTVRKCV